MNVEVYTLEDRDGNPVCDGWHTQDIKEARTVAEEHKARIIANIFEFADSELVEDYTEEEEVQS